MFHLLNDANLRTHTCEAMNTTFTLRLECPDADRAKEAASACFNQLESLENDLSRFRHDSDVSRINHLQAGKTLYISDITHACLLKAFDANALTNGLFDITLGASTWPEGHASPPAENTAVGQLEIAPDQPRVTCRVPGREIDLGGIGKGFALDQLAGTLASYGIGSALLSAGASTLLALGPRSRPIALTGNGVTEEIELKGRALSVSGTGIQGAHVVHPGHPAEDPQYLFPRVWLTADHAAAADACSTACLLMAEDELEAFAEAHRGDMVIYAENPASAQIRRI